MKSCPKCKNEYSEPADTCPKCNIDLCTGKEIGANDKNISDIDTVEKFYKYYVIALALWFIRILTANILGAYAISHPDLKPLVDILCNIKVVDFILGLLFFATYGLARHLRTHNAIKINAWLWAILFIIPSIVPFPFIKIISIIIIFSTLIHAKRLLKKLRTDK